MQRGETRLLRTACVPKAARSEACRTVRRRTVVIRGKIGWESGKEQGIVLIFSLLRYTAFLAVALACYYFSRPRWRPWVLLCANVIFYCRSGAAGLIWIGLSVLSTWAAALALRKVDKARGRKVLWACALFNLGLLAVFKYLPAAGVGNIWPAPLGISFYTLQVLAYLTDVSAGRREPEKSLLYYAGYVSFFPTVMSGPIERSGTVLPQLHRAAACSGRALFHYPMFVQGLISILWGGFLKVVIADRLSVPVETVYTDYAEADGLLILVMALCYSLRLYCDFASYSCIAAGVAALFGIRLSQNFRQPYFARSFSDFWNRWHITLSSWLRDYIYIPLGGNRRGPLRKYVNLLVVFGISGLWHGGAGTFLAWGCLHGLFLVQQDLWRRRRPAGHRLPAGKETAKKSEATGKTAWLGGLADRAGVFICVTLAWIFFLSDSLEGALACYGKLFTGWNTAGMSGLLQRLGLNRIEFTVLACALLLLLLAELISERKKEELSAWLMKVPFPVRWACCLLLLVFLFVFGMYGSGYQASSYIYIQF